MIERSQVETPAEPAEVALLGVPNWLWPTVGKAVSAAAVMAMLYLEAAQSRDERLGLAQSPQAGPPSKLREILTLAGRPAPNLHEAFATLMGEPPPSATAATPAPGNDLRELLAHVHTLLGGTLAPAAPTPPTTGGPATGASPPTATASWPGMHWHAPASAPASSARPAANAPPTTHLPAGLVSTDHLPRYRPEFTREGASKRPTSAAQPTTPTSPPTSPKAPPATSSASAPAPAPASEPSTSPSPPSPPPQTPAPAAVTDPDPSASPPPAPPPTLLEVVLRTFEASTVHLDTLTARIAAMEARLAAHEARDERPIEAAPAPTASSSAPTSSAFTDGHTPATASTVTASTPAPSPSPDPALAEALALTTPEELHQVLLLVAQHGATTGQRALHLAARLGAVESRFASLERGSRPEPAVEDAEDPHDPDDAEFDDSDDDDAISDEIDAGDDADDDTDLDEEAEHEDLEVLHV